MLYLLSCHFPEERVMVSINRFFYEEFYIEPSSDGDDAKRDMVFLEKIFWQSLKFIAKYFKACSSSMNVDGVELDDFLVKTNLTLLQYRSAIACTEMANRALQLTATQLQ